MAKKEKYHVKTLTLSDFENLVSQVDSFKSSDFDEHCIDEESIKLEFYSDGSISIHANFVSSQWEEITI